MLGQEPVNDRLLTARSANGNVLMGRPNAQGVGAHKVASEIVKPVAVP